MRLPTVQRELTIQFRSSWTYSLFVILSAFIILILYVSSDVAGIGQYNHATGTLMNLLGYLLPLMTLVMGTFSLTLEKEDGSWTLLSTYPIASAAWIIGKYAGNLLVLAAIITFAFSIAGLISYVWQSSITFDMLVPLYLYALSLVVVFLALAVMIGVFSRNRWQALTITVTVWIVFVLAWPVLLMSLLHSLSYRTVISVLEFVTFLNPAEFTRIFFTVKLGGGHVFGPLYIDWLQWAQGTASHWYYLGLLSIWLLGLIGGSVLVVERRRYRGS